MRYRITDPKTGLSWYFHTLHAARQGYWIMKLNENPEYLDAYHRAMHADAAFHDELVRQFGLKRAGDMRYHACKHDNATTKAREAKRTADAKLHEFWDKEKAS